MKLIYLIISILLLCGCNQPSQTISDIQGESVQLSYATGFTIDKADSITIITVKNPWKKGEIHSRYYLVKNDSIVVPPDGQKVIIPIKSMMINSATYLGFLDLLDQLDKVTGVCNANYIYNPSILERVKKGEIKDLGESFNIDIENLLLLKPDVVMTTAYNADDANSTLMKQSGLKIIYNIEWQEPSILGRTEWIKFIAAFVDQLPLADSLFNDINSKYQSACNIANQAQHRPTIFSGQDYRGTWSLAGGKSYTAQLFRDAHASYLYENDTISTSISSNIEQALINFSETDIWIGTQECSLNDLGQSNDKYRLFKAFRQGNVYNMNKRVNKNGGNDYWESAVVRPDLLLQDMIKICHPELLPEYETVYLEKLSANEK